jgi:hypothetical protein
MMAMPDNDEAMIHEAQKEVARQRSEQAQADRPAQEAAASQTSDATLTETRVATRTQELQTAKSADRDGELAPDADAAWNAARERDAQDLAVRWAQLSPDQEQQLKDAFRDLAERGDRAWQALVEDPGGNAGAHADIEEQVAGARRDVAQALNTAAPGRDEAVDIALRKLEARSAALTEPAVDASTAEARTATQDQEMRLARTADAGEKQNGAADAAWDQARDRDRQDLATSWDQLGSDQAQYLKDAFQDVAELADQIREVLVEQAADDDGPEVSAERFAAVDEQMHGARRDVAQALESARQQTDDSGVEQARQALEERGRELSALAAEMNQFVISDRDIAALLQRLDDSEFSAQGNGMRELRLNIDIDEPQAIANGGDWGEASNKEFLERMTNQVTKNRLEQQGERLDLTTISLREAMEQGEQAFREAAFSMLDRRFSEVEELETVVREARDAMRNLDRDARDLANALNAAIRDRIANESTEAARLVAEALRATGVELRRKRQGTA